MARTCVLQQRSSHIDRLEGASTVGSIRRVHVCSYATRVIQRVHPTVPSKGIEDRCVEGVGRTCVLASLCAILQSDHLCVPSSNQIIPLQDGESVTSMLPVSDFSEASDLVMLTRKGFIKKTALQAFADTRKNGLIAINLVRTVYRV